MRLVRVDGLNGENRMRQSQLYFVVSGLCAAAAMASLFVGRANVITGLGLLLAAVALWVGLSHRRVGR